MALFAGVGFAFLFVNLLVGKLLRPHDPHAEKLEVYECGEPTIGSSFVQFDLRFYVVALLFIIFDVEVAFFFPWAKVFRQGDAFERSTVAAGGRAPDRRTQSAACRRQCRIDARGAGTVSRARHRQARRAGAIGGGCRGACGALVATRTAAEAGESAIRDSAHRLAWLSMWDIAVFFAVLMVGFAYVWRRGDLDWVRAMTHERPAKPRRRGRCYRARAGDDGLVIIALRSAKAGTFA